jgi:hypothetical protein
MGRIQLRQRNLVGVCICVDLPFAPDLGVGSAQPLFFRFFFCLISCTIPSSWRP